MEVNNKTKYLDFVLIEQCITPESRKALIAGAQAQYGYYGQLTIDQFWSVVNGDKSLLGDMSEPLVLQVYWLYGFEEYCKGFTEALEKLVVPENPNDKDKYNMGCVNMSAQETMLIFTREYFGLPSFFAAGKRTIGEYLTARKDKFNQAMMQHNFAESQKAKFKKK